MQSLNSWITREVSPICIVICFLARPIPRKVGVCLTEPISEVRSLLIFKWELMFSLLLLPVPEVIWKQVKTPEEGLHLLCGAPSPPQRELAAGQKYLSACQSGGQPPLTFLGSIYKPLLCSF